MIGVFYCLADWLMLEYFGRSYRNHCGGTRRKAIFNIRCDRSADTHVSSYPQGSVVLKAWIGNELYKYWNVNSR